MGRGARLGLCQHPEMLEAGCCGQLQVCQSDWQRCLHLVCLTVSGDGLGFLSLPLSVMAQDG